MLEIYLLEQLEAFARCGTLSAAAEELHLSQPALTRSMKKLEEVIGVPLFERQKNKLTLNENGRLAAEYARRVLDQDREIVERVRAFDRASRTISIGSCAPVPLDQIVPVLSRLYVGMTISQELGNDDALLERLLAGEHKLVILHEQPEDESLHWKPCSSEKLFLVVPSTHPLAKHEKGIRLKELEGQSILLFSQIGFWYELCKEKIPHPRFILQDDFHTFGELAYASALPVFTTDYWVKRDEYASDGRVLLPILDPEASVNYYLACAGKDRRRFKALFEQIEA
ncbi:MAG: LysR family transcriptional regulator [Oscillospiraceae bacterium]|nr:LysR family transcriptional regulator [Oscillospiraceae bacterium]